jgi:hypothetical protein
MPLVYPHVPFPPFLKNLEDISRFVNQNFIEPLAARHIFFDFKLVPVVNKIAKPGPVFNEVARYAYNAGASFFFRVNDDTEFIETWATAFSTALLSLKPPYGVIGPTLHKKTTQIFLAHDFTHRLHMEIFSHNYYPIELPDWNLDVWISAVYGRQRSLQTPYITVHLV